MCASDSLETILSHLSTKVINVIADGNCPQHLHYLLEFLAAWEKRPECLTSMAYQWCSAISEAAGRLKWGDRTGRQEILRLLRLKLQDLARDVVRYFLQFAEDEFSEAGGRCDSLRLGDTSHRVHGRPPALTTDHYMDLLRTSLEIGFRLVTPGRDQRLTHTPHHDRMFETAFSFSGNEDDVIADVVSVWILLGDQVPPGSCTHYLAKHIERDAPFSPRSRRMSIHAIERIWHNEREVLGPETVRLLNYLDVDVDDMVNRYAWVRPLVGVICLPTGLETLSSHYWRLLDKLAFDLDFRWIPGSCNVDVMRSLKKAEDWEKLEVWTVVVWQSLKAVMPISTMEDIEQVTLKLLLQRPPASQMFQILYKQGFLWAHDRDKLERVCDEARVGQSLSKSLPPYVSVRPAQYLSVLMSLVSLPQSTDSRPPACSASFYGRRHFLKAFIVLIVG